MPDLSVWSYMGNTFCLISLSGLKWEDTYLPSGDLELDFLVGFSSWTLELDFRVGFSSSTFELNFRVQLDFRVGFSSCKKILSSSDFLVSGFTHRRGIHFGIHEVTAHRPLMRGKIFKPLILVNRK